MPDPLFDLDATRDAIRLVRRLKHELINTADWVESDHLGFVVLCDLERKFNDEIGDYLKGREDQRRRNGET
jgi:hypothetical protein